MAAYCAALLHAQPTLISDPTTDYQTLNINAGVATLANGGRAMLHLHQIGGDQYTWEPMPSYEARVLVYNAANQLVTTVVANEAANPGDSVLNAAIAPLANGGFVVAWTGAKSTGDYDAVYYATFDNDGTPADPEGERHRSVSTRMGDKIAVTGLAGGGFAVVFSSADNAAAQRDFVCTFSYGGALNAFTKLNEAQIGWPGVDTVTAVDGTARLTISSPYPRIAGLTDGSFVVLEPTYIWMRPTYTPLGEHAFKFASTGEPLNFANGFPHLRINWNQVGRQGDLVALSNGGFATLVRNYNGKWELNIFNNDGTVAVESPQTQAIPQDGESATKNYDAIQIASLYGPDPVGALVLSGSNLIAAVSSEIGFDIHTRSVSTGTAVSSVVDAGVSPASFPSGRYLANPFLAAAGEGGWAMTYDDVYSDSETYYMTASVYQVGFVPVSSAPTVSVTSMPNPSVYGETVVFAATVSPLPSQIGTPTGFVTFVLGSGASTFTVPLDASGQASIVVADLSADTHSVEANYLGDETFESASSGVSYHTVTAASTTTTVAATPDPSVYGQIVTISATVTVDAPGSGTPTGTVTFVGAGLNQTVVLDARGQAALTTTTLESGTISATYNGDAGFNASVGMIAVTVEPAASTTTVIVSPDPSVSGENVQVSATVTLDAPASGTPTGTVTFVGAGGLNQTVVLDASGTAALTTTGLESGTITATYNGDGTVMGSSASVTVTVNPAATTTVVTATPDRSTSGENVEITATVSINAPGAGIPTGTVTFTGPGGLNTTAALDLSGTASITTGGLSSGTVTATYNGDFRAAASSGSTGVLVFPAATTTAVSATPDPSLYGQAVTLSAQVTVLAPGSGTPTGTVTFTGPGGLNMTTVLDVTGKAAITTTSLQTGTVTATYNGDFASQPSTGTTTVTVEQGSTVTTVTATPDPSVYGQSVEVFATVAAEAPASGTPTGTVTFTGPGGLNQTVVLDGTGQAGLTTTTLATGTISAVYNGDAGFAGSVGTAMVTVNPADTTTVVTATPNPSVHGESVTVTATIAAAAPATGTPAGTVTFVAGSLVQTVALHDGSASFTTTSLESGVITATYEGSFEFNGSSATTTVTVNEGSTAITLTATPTETLFGELVKFTAIVSAAPPAAGTPSGSVKFMDGSAKLATVALVDGEASFSTTALTAGLHEITATYSGDGTFETATSTMIEVTVEPGYHSADTDFNWKLSLAELTRVIELYNTRDGDTRTGEYHLDSHTEDGFASGPGTLVWFHSADVNEDGKISLIELTRVIELYNTRDGDTRTGAYHADAQTEDGFAAGPELIP